MADGNMELFDVKKIKKELGLTTKELKIICSIIPNSFLNTITLDNKNISVIGFSSFNSGEYDWQNEEHWRQKVGSEFKRNINWITTNAYIGTWEIWE
jgi:hypothetical protein